MSAKVHITDGLGTGQKVGVTSEGALIVSMYECPPHLTQKQNIFRQYMTTDGTAGGTFDMRQTGTLAAPVSFYIQAPENSDRYITLANIVVCDATITGLHTFGAVTALTNGCRFYYKKNTNIYDIHPAIQHNFEIMRLCNFYPALTGTIYGGGGTVKDPTFVAGSSDVGAATQAVVGILDFTKIIPPYGLKLDSGTSQRLVMDIRDTTTGVDEFNVICYGFDRYL